MKIFLLTLLIPFSLNAQLKWKNVDSLYQPLPEPVHVYFTEEPIDTGMFRAFFLVADLKNKKLDFTTDTTYKRRLTPSKFYEKNNQPLVVVNGTFFSFETNQNLNIVVKDGKLLSFNAPQKGKGKDSLKYFPSYASAIGINKNREADVAWTKTDSVHAKFKAVQFAYTPYGQFWRVNKATGEGQKYNYDPFEKWKVVTAIGGGPVLVQKSEIKISNEQEQKFTGKAINDKHPRTAMGYTDDNRLIILVIEGRNPNAGGATLIQEAQILKDLGCLEALNLDGGGSSCLLINGKETIKPCDKEGQRAIPAVFIIHSK